jgi:hypothetical protein
VLSTEHGSLLFLGWAIASRGRGLVTLGQAREGVALLTQGLTAAWDADGTFVLLPSEDLTDEQKVAISEVATEYGKNGRTTKVKLHDKLAAKGDQTTTRQACAQWRAARIEDGGLARFHWLSLFRPGSDKPEAPLNARPSTAAAAGARSLPVRVHDNTTIRQLGKRARRIA